MKNAKKRIDKNIQSLQYVLSYKLDEDMKSVYRTVEFIGAVCTVLLIVVTLLNTVKSNSIMISLTLFLSITFFIATLFAHFKKGIGVIKVIISTAVCIVFSYFIIIGGNEGFAALWIILVPFSLMSLWGLNFGLVFSLYLLVTVITLFWTPVGAYILQYEYSDSFCNRFPLLYMLTVVLAIVLNYQIKVLRIRKENEQTILQEAVQTEHNRVKNLAIQSITAISKAVEAKDEYTNQHSERVAQYSMMIANELGWSDKEKRNLYQTALLHDIGKIGIADAVLNKSEKLTDEEYALMKRHPIIGGDILSNMTLMTGITNGAYYHHERFDGKGYPYGLKGANIPIEARIIGLADTVDAINSNRVYRQGVDKDYLLNELRKGKGTQFDPELADIFINIILRGELELEHNK